MLGAKMICRIFYDHFATLALRASAFSMSLGDPLVCLQREAEFRGLRGHMPLHDRELPKVGPG